MTYLLRFIGFATVFISASPLASLVDHGTYFTNTVTNTDYYKLGQTTLNSWTDVVSNDSSGLINEGWQVASQTEYFDMATHADTKDDMWQFCDVCQEYNFVFSITNGDMSGGQVLLPSHIKADYFSANGSYTNFSHSYSSDIRHFAIGVALSRPSAVPIPAAAWLFGSAFMGLGLARKR